MKFPYAIVWIVCMVFTGFSGVAQSKWEVGLRAGLTFAGLANSKAEQPEGFSGTNNQQSHFFYDYETNFKDDVKIGTSLFIYGNYPITERINFQAEVGYVQKGIELNDAKIVYKIADEIEYQIHSIGSFTYSRRISNNYISFPLSVKFNLDRKEMLYVRVGLFTDFLVNSEVKGKQSSSKQVWQEPSGVVYESGESTSVFTAPSQTAKVDFGLIGAVGFQFPINDKLLVAFDMSLCHGLTKIDGKNDNTTRIIPVTSGMYVVHENYHGLNSDARSITLSNTVGITYKFTP